MPFDDLRAPTRTVTGMPEYAVSKLCNVLFTKELARGRAGANVQSFALHPGVVATDVWRRIPPPFRQLGKLFMKTAEAGAATTLHCATSPEVRDGAYYDDRRERRPSAVADDPALARELWARSAAWCGLPE